MSIRGRLNTALLAAALALTPVGVFAQEGAPPNNVRMRIGPLFVNPTLSLSNAGRDTNVFNDSVNPQEDFTVTITPATDLWLRLGPTWIQSNIKEDIVWFQKFASERSANNSYVVKWLVPLNRLTLSTSGIYANTRQRPGFEIDTRAEHTQQTYVVGAEFRLLSKTFIGVEARSGVTQFDSGATFLGTNLSDQLNETTRTVSLGLRHQVTALTALSFTASNTQDRFQLNPLRNSDSRGLSGTIKFDPAALIKGSATFGYREFRPASPDVPGYSGTTAAVDLSYVLLGVTKFGATATRDVQYSYDVNQPYYLQTGMTGSIGQQLFGPLDVVLSGGFSRLEYRDRVGAVIVAPNRTDRQTTFGGGIGYHLGRDTRIGVNVSQAQRRSPLTLHTYNEMQYGISVTYGS
jgi:hypothetical protein